MTGTTSDHDPAGGDAAVAEADPPSASTAAATSEPPAAESGSFGYFQTQLRALATTPGVAVPATIDDLRNRLLAYLGKQEVEAIHRAYRVAERAHAGQMRRTGHDYITHPLAVASILTDMRMDHESIMAALLHDVLEDTGASKQSLAKMFGEQVADIVDGVSKLSTIFASRAEAQAENFQKMAMATVRDLRVILVKLADRLHNMRTIGALAPSKRIRIARETLEFYAPIANRLGMNTVRVELEELAFQALYPLRADRIGRAAVTARKERAALVDNLKRSIEAGLRRESIDAQVFVHERHIHSIYQLLKEGEKFEHIMAVCRFRIVVDQVDTCYRALGVLHSLYKPVPTRFSDYIAIPKANGYQSLHSRLLGMYGMHDKHGKRDKHGESDKNDKSSKSGKSGESDKHDGSGVPIEVQIRTREMDAVAANGIAGQWLYRHEQGHGHHDRARQWVAGLLELQQRAGNSLEFIESLKSDLFPDEVYVFTPKGEIFELPHGACAVDLAYAIHTNIGNHCAGCRVDRALGALSAPLQSGQTVEILTSENARPNPAWLEFAVSGRARSAIRQALKSQRREDSVRLGRSLLDRSLAHGGTSIKALDFRRLRGIFRDFGVRRLDDLLAEIGIGNLMAYSVAQRLLAADNPDYEAVDVEQGGTVAIRGGEGLVITYGRCCGPVPGDAIAGHITPGRGLVVHLETCSNIKDARRREPLAVVPARWAEHPVGDFETTVIISVQRRKGTIAELAAAANDADVGIDKIAVDERSADLSIVRLDLSVTGSAQLNHVQQRLRAIPAVQRVKRIGESKPAP